MKIIGSKKDNIKKEIDWQAINDKRPPSKRNNRLGKKPKVNLKLEDNDNGIVTLTKENSYYEICDIESTIKLPVKIGSTIERLSYLGKEDFVVIKATAISREREDVDELYRIELYDPVKSTVGFGIPIYAFDFHPEMKVDKAGLLKYISAEEENKEENMLDIFALAVKYIMAKHYDVAINKMLSIKRLKTEEFCIDPLAEKLCDIIDDEVFFVDFDIKALLLQFINRAKESYKNRPKKSVGIFGNFNIGIAPIHGNYLLLRLDNKINSVSILNGKIASWLRNNSPINQFTVLHSKKDK